MTDLIALLGTGEARWNYVSQLIDHEQWDTIFLITTAQGAQQFRAAKPCTFILYDENMKLPDMVLKLSEQLRGKAGFEVAINCNAGSGKESMALISTLLKIGTGFRPVAYTKENGVQEL